MISWKRTLLGALCVCVMVSAPALAEEPADAATRAGVDEAEGWHDAPAEDLLSETEASGEAAVEDAEAATEAALAPADEAWEGAAALGDEAWEDAEALAEETPEAAAALDSEIPLDAPSDPAAEVATRTAPALGAVGYDSEGRQGRIHLVITGDTLWDISDAYLGTPWVWPSIWNDNGEIENPHLIHPGNRIWITPTEMRRITAEEADALLANTPAAPDPIDEAPAALDTDSLAATAMPAIAPEERRSVRVAAREYTGLISPDLYTSAASVVGRVSDRLLMSQEDRVYIGLGESEVEVGDEFTLFRTNERVFDPDTGRLLGYHVDFIGWVRVEETYAETSLASIRMSTDVVEQGDRIMPREPLPPEIDLQAPPSGVEGKISFFPGRRVLMGFADFVYLNRGTLDGVEVGSPLEVFRDGYRAVEVSRDEKVGVPSRVIAQMIVVRATDESSVAVVMAAEGELELGDRFRAATRF